MSDVPKQQNTHWYKVHHGSGFTADPRQGHPRSVGEVGLHECSILGCMERHACNGDDYAAWILSGKRAGEA